MTDTLLDLANACEREASSMWASQRERWALRDTATLFRRMVCNRQAVDPTRLTITMSMLLDVPERWCRQHGYRAVAGRGGYVIQRNDEPVVIAGIGDTLLWDGERIMIRSGQAA